MRNLILILKGIVLGISNLIPGVSGGTMAIIMKIYEKMLSSVNNIFKKFKESMIFLLPLAIGILISVLLGSKVINFCLDKFPIPTTLFFVGLVVGGIPLLYKNIHKKYNLKNVVVLLIAFVIVLCLMFVPNTEKTTDLRIIDYILIFICGMISAAAMIIPGISGSMVLMLLGYYNTVIEALKNLTDFSLISTNLMILIPFGIGAIIGFLGCCKLVSVLIKKFPIESYFGIIGFVLASAIVIIYNSTTYEFKTSHLIVGIILAIVGFFITFVISKFDKPDEPEEITKLT